MADLPDGTGIGGLIGIGITAIITGFLALRKNLSSDSVARASNDAQLQIIQMLQDQVKQERSRADAAVVARDQAVDQIGLLRVQVAQLSQQVESLKLQVMGVGAAQNSVAKT